MIFSVITTQSSSWMMYISKQIKKGNSECHHRNCSFWMLVHFSSRTHCVQGVECPARCIWQQTLQRSVLFFPWGNWDKCLNREHGSNAQALLAFTQLALVLIDCLILVRNSGREGESFLLMCSLPWTAVFERGGWEKASRSIACNQALHSVLLGLHVGIETCRWAAGIILEMLRQSEVNSLTTAVVLYRIQLAVRCPLCPDASTCGTGVVGLYATSHSMVFSVLR